MRHFAIKNFRGIEGHRDPTELGRGGLSIAEGFVCTPTGSLRSGPTWVTDHTLTPSVGNGSKFFKITGLGFKMFAQVVSYGGDYFARMISTASNESNADPGDGMTSTELTTDASLDRAYATKLGRKLLFNKGGSNFLYNPSDDSLTALVADTSDRYAYEKANFPVCNSWVVGPDYRLYGAVNASAPLRLWLTVNPDISHQEKAGLESSELSYVDILYPQATRITALSVSGPNIVVHTDAGLVMLETPGEGQDPLTAMRTRQYPSPANAGACNPNCVSHDGRNYPLYFGRDKRIYKDEAARRGNYGSPTDRAAEDDAYKSDFGISAAFTWESSMAENFQEYAFSLYDQDSSLFFVWTPLVPKDNNTNGFGLYVYNALARTLSGPIRYPDLQTATLVRSHDENYIVGIDKELRVVWTSVEWLKESLGAPKNTSYTPSASDPAVVLDATPTLASTIFYPRGDTGTITAGLSLEYEADENSWVWVGLSDIPTNALLDENGDALLDELTAILTGK